MQKLYTDSKMRLLLENGEGKKNGRKSYHKHKHKKKKDFFFYQSLAPDKKKQKKDDQSVASDTLLKAKTEFSRAFSCLQDPV